MAANNTSEGMSQNGKTLLLISTGMDCNQSPTSRLGSAAAIGCNTPEVPIQYGKRHEHDKRIIFISPLPVGAESCDLFSAGTQSLPPRLDTAPPPS